SRRAWRTICPPAARASCSAHGATRRHSCRAKSCHCATSPRVRCRDDSSAPSEKLLMTCALVKFAQPASDASVQGGMMKHKLSLFLAVAAGSLAFSVAAYADDTNSPVDPGHPRVTEVQKRQANQQDRIAKGLEKGSLTPGEATRLEKRENRIEKQK